MSIGIPGLAEQALAAVKRQRAESNAHMAKFRAVDLYSTLESIVRYDMGDVKNQQTAEKIFRARDLAQTVKMLLEDKP